MERRKGAGAAQMRGRRCGMRRVNGIFRAATVFLLTRDVVSPYFTAH
jgi:hypothetical protein